MAFPFPQSKDTFDTEINSPLHTSGHTGLCQDWTGLLSRPVTYLINVNQFLIMATVKLKSLAFHVILMKIRLHFNIKDC